MRSLEATTILTDVRLREYQDRACGRVTSLLITVRGVCLVAPTGSGKTVMGEELVRRCEGITLWLTHTKELVSQTAERLAAAGLSTGIIAAGFYTRSGCKVYVASAQTLVSRDMMPLCDQIIVDEAHHFISQDWSAIISKYPFTKRIGLTATPERADGRPLAEVFDEIVVAAHYSELTEAGYLVPVRILRPDRELDKGVAMDPVQAYRERGEGRKFFMYCKSVKLAYDAAEQLTATGIPTACIEANTTKEERADRIAAFKDGRLRGLTNMNTLTEGVDVPDAACCVLGRPMGHVSTYLQAGGRVLRVAPSKIDALILDLPGLSHRFGPPNENRLYSLAGEGIRRSPLESLRVCLHCGMTFVPRGAGACPRCSELNPQQKPRPMRVYNEALHEYFNGPGTPEWVKKAELTRLEDVAKSRGFNDAWVARQFKATFQELPEAWRPADTRKKTEFRRLMALATEKGYSPGWAAHRYKSTYGAYPPRGWQMELSSGADSQE